MRSLKVRKLPFHFHAAIIALVVVFLSISLLTKPLAQAQQTDPASLVLPIGRTLQVFSAEDVNAYLASKGYIYPPFLAHSQVPETMPSQTLRFVRVYNPADNSNQTGRWIMRAEFIRGLTPEQIRDRFALPSVPTHITLVDIPSNVAPLLTGIAGPIAQYGPGGGQQSYIVGDGYQFPASAFIHPQALTADAMSYAPVVGGGNAGQVASYLDGFIPRPYSDLEGVYDKLDFLNWTGFGSGPLRAAMEQLSPEPYDAFAHIAVRNSLLFGSTLLQRGQYLRQAMAGSASSSQAPNRLAYAGDMGNAPLADASQSSSSFLKGASVWLKGAGEFGDQSGSAERTGFSYQTGGPVFGVDYHFREDVYFGFGVGYLRTGLDWDNDRGSADMDSTAFGLYGGYAGSLFFVESAFTGGVNWMSTQRQIDFLDLSRTAKSSLSGDDIAFQIRGGANFVQWGWELTPMAEVGYFNTSQSAFTEHGADSLNLNVESRDAQTFRSELKVQVARGFAINEGLKLTPSVDVGWAHQIPLGDRGITASLSDIGGGFTVRGFDDAEDTCLVGAGLVAAMANHLTFYAYYRGELSGEFNAHGVNVGLRYSF
jgi:outer membrane autotransporter protein